MSIYGSFFSIEDERQWIADLEADGIGGGVIRDGDPAPEDLDAPYVYQGSHILPEPDHPRGGSVDLAAIGAHVRFWREHPDADPRDEPEGPDEPFLRLGVSEGGKEGSDATVLLTVEQVQRLVNALNEWIGATKRGGEGHDSKELEKEVR